MRKVIAGFLLSGLLLAVGSSAALAQEAKPQRGLAAVYALKLVGHRTASGETLDRQHLTTAHRSLPFGTIIEVTNRANGRKALIRVNDRGPYRRKFLLDLSPAAAAALGIGLRSTAPIELRVADKP
jgi:peptidoglycan lytic transglycosylase